MATVDVLKKAAEKGYNLIITHDPTYYNHLDSRDKLENDPVYAAKQETIEYVRDASQAGLPMALVILGHAVSEEAGMAYCAQWLQSFISEIPVAFIEAGDPFHE